ncbi:hypothetical protein B488_07770 [Liberibacter crescens BT-1]|uniref:Uncharacterized protein n=1 Tax=Liberibacter crescens (strain BT-1) TaxID=1215343 RepID=L0ETA4_LIBCB|nr:hypothetical protein [Liberibacter crescens]AGA64769.1 hypothetical protein B488_07770 [Liberibacter crescens BT-1]AMC12840.1 hypothetical protein RL73_03940 [Liberibacter crescens]
MTILSLINTVCHLVGLSPFSSVYGHQDDDARLFIALVQETGEEISMRVDWPDLLNIFLVSTTPSNIPGNFHRPLSGGAVVMRDGCFARPVVTAADWDVVKKGSGGCCWYWLTSRRLHLSCPPPAFLRYFSLDWVIDQQGNNKSTVTSDDDKIIFSDYLFIKGMIWRWRRMQGLSFQDHLQEFEAALSAETLKLLEG